MKDEINCSYNGGGVVYLLQSGAIHFNLTVQTAMIVLLISNFREKYVLLEYTLINSLFHKTQISLQISSSKTKYYTIVFDRPLYTKRINNQPTHHSHRRQTIPKNKPPPLLLP